MCIEWNNLNLWIIFILRKTRSKDSFVNDRLLAISKNDREKNYISVYFGTNNFTLLLGRSEFAKFRCCTVAIASTLDLCVTNSQSPSGSKFNPCYRKQKSWKRYRIESSTPVPRKSAFQKPQQIIAFALEPTKRSNRKLCLIRLERYGKNGMHYAQP